MSFLDLITFDVLSFWIGFLVAVGVAYFFFRIRGHLSEFRETMTESYRTALEALTSTAAQGYRTDLMRWAQSSHLASHLFSLDEILQTPRFMVPPAPLDPTQSAEYDSPTLYPFTPDWPQLAEAYGYPSLPLEQLLRSKSNLLLVGLPGSGKTIALAAYAIEWLKRSASSGSHADLPRSVFFANAHDLAFSALSKDTLAPLIPAVQHYASTIAASQIPGYLKGSMRGDGCVLLLDAMDEVAFPRQEEIRKWLQALLRQFTKVRVIVTLSPEKAVRWRAMGFAIASPAPWSKLEKHEFLERWGVRWQELVSSDRKGGESPDSALLTGWIGRHTFGLNPLDLTLRIWAAFSTDMQGNTSAAAQRSYLARILPTVAEDALGTLVRNMIADGFSIATRRQVENALAALWPRSEHPLPPVEDCFDDMLTYGLLHRRTGGRVSFCHAVIAARCAARIVVEDENLNALLAESVSPLADLTVQSMAAECDIATLISARLAGLVSKNSEENTDGMPPVIQEGWKVLALARSLRDAMTGAGWKVEVLRRLMKILRTPSQPYPLRTRALCAFLNSGDTSAVQLFRQLLTAPESDTDARVLATLGLGVMPDASTVEVLQQLLDSDLRELRWSGTLALGNIGSPAAMESLGQTLLSGEDDLRRGAAESLALDFAEGHAMLKEAIQDAEVMVRRAAVFGLAKTAQPWALEILEKIQVEDAQWAVKSAAGQAVERLHGDTAAPLAPPAAPSDLAWLIKFAAARKTGVAPGAPAVAMLQRAIREGDPLHRAAAAQAVGFLGDTKYIPDLFTAISDSEIFVRNAAFEALWGLQAAQARPDKD